MILRFAGLGAPIGPQELMALRPAQRPLEAILRLLYSNLEVADPPLFHVLLHGWGLGFGFSLFSVRVFTALIGLGAVAAAAWAAKKLSGERAAWLAAAVVSLHPFAVAYSLVARSYGLLLVFGFLIVGLLAEAERRDTVGAWTLFFGAALGAALTHNFGPFMTAAGLAWLAFRAATGRWRPSLRFSVPFAAAALLYSLWIPGLLFEMRSGFIPADDPSPLLAFYALSGIGVQVEHSATLWPAPFLILVASAALAFGLAFRCRPQARGVLAALAVGGALCLVPPIAYSYLISPVFNAWRHSIVALPAVCLFWAAALAEQPDPTAAGAFLALCLLFSYPLAGFLTKERTPFPAIAAAVAGMRAPGTIVLVQPENRREFLIPYDPAEAVRDAGLCTRDESSLPAAVIVAQVRLRNRVPPNERCDWRVLRERYARVETREFGWYAVVKRYALLPKPRLPIKERIPRP